MDSQLSLEEAGRALFLIYQRSLETLRKFDEDIQSHLERFFRVAGHADSVSVRDLAFLEGLRVERDQAFDALTSAEHNLLENLLARLGRN